MKVRKLKFLSITGVIITLLSILNTRIEAAKLGKASSSSGSSTNN